MRWALIAAITVHALLLLLPWGFPGSGNLFVPTAEDRQPVMVKLQQPDEPRRLIEPGAPAEQPVNPSTDLISEQASKAQDMSPSDTGGIVPDAGVVGPADQLVPQPAPAAAPPKPAPSAPEAASAPEAKKNPEAPPKPSADKKAATPHPDAPMVKVDEPTPPLPQAEEKPQDAAIQLAKAETAPTPVPAEGKSQSRVEGGVKSKGFLSFEAMESDFAPYLRQVRDRVEKRWKTLIHMRYSGVSTTQAVLDCAISPDGTLRNITIVEPGSSATFAGLCKQAVEQAGPFGAFPFQVPDMYKNQNIEIRWTFSFL